MSCWVFGAGFGVVGVFFRGEGRGENVYLLIICIHCELPVEDGTRGYPTQEA